MMKNFFRLLSFIGLFLIIGCNNDDDQQKVPLATFNVALSPSNSIPMVTGRNETGTAVMELYGDNTLIFTIDVDNLSSSDQLNVAHVHSGDVVSTGDVGITLVDGSDVSFSGGTASATLKLTQTQVALLQGDDIYINVHSVESPQGLLRGQVDQTIGEAYNVILSPGNEIPAITGRNESGIIYLRTVDNKLYYKVEVSDLEASDAIVAGHIHEGTSEENGDVLLNLDISSNDQINITKSMQLDESELDKLESDPLYVNIHSNQEPMGLMRGQIR